MWFLRYASGQTDRQKYIDILHAILCTSYHKRSNKVRFIASEVRVNKCHSLVGQPRPSLIQSLLGCQEEYLTCKKPVHAFIHKSSAGTSDERKTRGTDAGSTEATAVETQIVKYLLM